MRELEVTEAARNFPLFFSHLLYSCKNEAMKGLLHSGQKMKYLPRKPNFHVCNAVA
jgi:hypothetical protein